MPLKIWHAYVCFITLAFIAIMPANAIAKPQTLRGNVEYRERMALPPSALIEVQLVDVSRADAPAKLIAKTTVRANGRMPIAYRLRYNDENIQPRRRYALQATIRVDGKLWFTTTKHHAVFDGRPNRTNNLVGSILVKRVAAGKPARTASPSGKWQAELIGGKPVSRNTRTTLEIAPDGSISGTGGCNHMSGKAMIKADNVRFGRLASTNMACMPQAMNQEQKFFAALEKTRQWKIDPTGRKLALLDAKGKPMAVLTRM